MALKEAQQYKTLSDFFKKSPALYRAARKNGWLDDISQHMSKPTPKLQMSSDVKMTKAGARKIAKRFSSLTAFKNNEPEVYRLAHEKGWLDDLSKTMATREKGRKTEYTYEQVKKEALKYKTYREFRALSPRTYHAAIRRGWIKDISGHLTRPVPFEGTYEAVQEAALKFETRTAFQKGHSVAYKTARLSGWLDDVCSHMKRSKQ